MQANLTARHILFMKTCIFR